MPNYNFKSFNFYSPENTRIKNWRSNGLPVSSLSLLTKSKRKQCSMTIFVWSAEISKKSVLQLWMQHLNHSQFSMAVPGEFLFFFFVGISCFIITINPKSLFFFFSLEGCTYLTFALMPSVHGLPEILRFLYPFFVSWKSNYRNGSGVSTVVLRPPSLFN